MARTRRDFLKLMATSTVGAVLFTGCQVSPREFERQSPVRIPEDLVSGVDNFYATVCRQCSAGCGVLVRLVEGRAKKIEGNPDYPINRGKHCARGEASLQALYHPDRILGPLRRTGDRGTGRFEPIDWDTALDDLIGRLRQLQAAGQGGTLLAITEPLRGHRGLILDRFVSAFGGDRLVFEPLDQTPLRTAVQRVFGQDRLPEFEIERAQYLLSFGADFLGTWLSPVRYGRKYGEFRQGRPNRGTFVQVEPRFSMTAASADRWVPIRPGTEGVLALSLAHVIISEGLGDSTAAAAMTRGVGATALDAFRPDRAAQVTGVPADEIRALAVDFASKRPSLAIGGGPAAAHTNGLQNLVAVFALNFLVGSVGTPGGIRFNPGAPVSGLPSAEAGQPLSTWQGVVERMRTGQPRPLNMVLVHNANPVHGLPRAVGFGEALARVPYIVSFSSFVDETTAMADLVLPDHVFLEDWGDDVPDPAPGFQVVGLQQPVVRPFGDTRSFMDVILTVAEELGGDVRNALPWNTFRDALRDGARQLQALGRGSVQALDFEEFWTRLLQQGGWWDERAVAQVTAPAPPALPSELPLPTFAGPDQEFPFHLIVFPSNSWGGGELAHLPWLQALPDPTTTVVWQSWLEINPRAADQMGIRTGDIVAVESPVGTVEVPAYVHPATPPDVVAIPAGQGHTAFTGYARERGVNPLDIVAPLVDDATGALAWAATRVRLRKTDRQMRLPRFEGVVPPLQPPDAELVPIAPS